MKMVTSFTHQHMLAIFCALTIALTSVITVLPLPGEVILIVMVFIPALMAIFLTALSEGESHVRSLLRKLAPWRISLKWVALFWRWLQNSQSERRPRGWWMIGLQVVLPLAVSL